MEEEAREFEVIYRTYFPRMLAYLGRLLGRHEAEDVTQEVFLKVNAGLGGFRGDSSLSTWIYRIATNAAMDHLRKSRAGLVEADREEGVPDRHLPDETAGSLYEVVPPPDRQLIRKEMNDCIRGIVEGLPENYRTVLILSDLEGLTNSEIGEVLGISLEAVKIRLHRGRARLKKELEVHCTFYRDDQNELACDRKSSPLKFLEK